MARCPSCDYPLPDDRDKIGSRCQNCHDPLYEQPGRVGRPAREGEGQCPVHAGIETVGTCRRCGNYICEVCRTRWRESILCAACVQRALDARGAAPEMETTERRQAILSLGLGAGLWGVAVAGFLIAILLIGTATNSGNAGAAILGGLIILATIAVSGMMAVFGIGSATSVLRTRGSYMLLATAGLLLSCLFLGGAIGFLTFSFYFAGA